MDVSPLSLSLQWESRAAPLVKRSAPTLDHGQQSDAHEARSAAPGQQMGSASRVWTWAVPTTGAGCSCQ